MKEKINYYKLAPTFLFNKNGETKSFKTQEEVDKAWGNGWFGPRNLAKSSPLISTLDYPTKADTVAAVRDDPRYEGCAVNAGMSVKDIDIAIAEFEVDNEVSEDTIDGTDGQ